jgi:hypothetical protein
MYTSAEQSASSMLLHEFTHSDLGYQVWLSRDHVAFLDVRLAVANTEFECALLPGCREFSSELSPQAIRSGLIATAEWVVKTGRWPDRDTRSRAVEQQSPITTQVR